jgi:hypothetical protein
MSIEEQIEEILMESSAYGLRNEVMEYAEKFMKEGYDKVTSYELSFQEWIK